MLESADYSINGWLDAVSGLYSVGIVKLAKIDNFDESWDTGSGIAIFREQNYAYSKRESA